MYGSFFQYFKKLVFCLTTCAPLQPPEKKKSYKEVREEQLAAEKAAKEAAEQPEVGKLIIITHVLTIYRSRRKNTNYKW